MSGISDYLENAWLTTLRGQTGKADFVAPTAIYVQLHTGDPTDVGTSNVSSVTTRRQVTFAAPHATNGTMSSDSAVSWTNWGGSSETITHITLWNASTDGKCLWRGTVDGGTGKAVTIGDTLTFAIGAITLTLA